ncbi:hypothetical protein GCM10027275_22790 [Rhabdobacter roseus]|uniref:Uncharacterized protein n=1 Tax=Rhabdobacter roseus TaxID=1655419 RepID=A0A840TJ45_9BACT|nr:hypothetical protein [Rhabdobacter roseus]MBB5284216.1 hypothetical protein [Rhabdobacter roseus]
MKKERINDEENQQLEQDEIVQTHSNLGLMDIKPGESTFPTGTKNHSDMYDHALGEPLDDEEDEESMDELLDDLDEDDDLEGDTLDEESYDDQPERL